MGKHPTGLCEHCQTPETVHHAVPTCTKYRSERKDMLEELERLGMKGREL